MGAQFHSIAVPHLHGSIPYAVTAVVVRCAKLWKIKMQKHNNNNTEKQGENVTLGMSNT